MNSRVFLDSQSTPPDACFRHKMEEAHLDLQEQEAPQPRAVLPVVAGFHRAHLFASQKYCDEESPSDRHADRVPTFPLKSGSAWEELEAQPHRAADNALQATG